jgi:hypothetical protein
MGVSGRSRLPLHLGPVKGTITRVMKSVAAAVRVKPLLAVLVLGLAFTACGGSEAPPREPRIPASLAAELAAQADAVAASAEAGDRCGAKERALALQADVAEALSAGRIPPAFRQELQAAVDELVQIECVPAEPPPTEPPPEADSCEALEERRKELEEEKEQIKEIEDEEERKAREAELEAEKKAVEEELKACKEEEKE